MLATWLHHCLNFGIGIAATLILFGLSDRQRGLAVGQSLRRRLPTAAVVLGVLSVWVLLPMAWHLPLAVSVGVLGVGWLFWDALRPGGSLGRPGTGAGKGAV